MWDSGRKEAKSKSAEEELNNFKNNKLARNNIE